MLEKYENIRFITCYETKNTVMFCSARDSIPIQQKHMLSTKSLFLVEMKMILEKLIII